MSSLMERSLAVFIIIFITSLFYSCITPAPIDKPTPLPTIVATQTPMQNEFHVQMPAKVSQGQKFRITVTASEDTWVAIWADKKWDLGDMRWDNDKKIKYLDVTLDTRGTRQIGFRVNDMWVYFQNIEVVP